MLNIKYIKFYILVMALNFFKLHLGPAFETPKEASKSVLKTEMTIMIRDIIESSGWTQLEASKVLGVDQPRVSDLMRGKIDKFTIDALISILGRSGFKSSFVSKNNNEAEIKVERVATSV